MTHSFIWRVWVQVIQGSHFVWRVLFDVIQCSHLYMNIFRWHFFVGHIFIVILFYFSTISIPDKFVMIYVWIHTLLFLWKQSLIIRFYTLWISLFHYYLWIKCFVKNSFKMSKLKDPSLIFFFAQLVLIVYRWAYQIIHFYLNLNFHTSESYNP